jgi:hypothetical protein
MMIWILTILTLINSPGTEKLEYDVYYRQRDIGDFTAERTVYKDIVEYRSESTTRLHLMGSVEVAVMQSAHYEKGVLIRSEAITRVNGHLHDEVLIRRIGTRYEITKNGKSYQLGDEIHYSMIKLIFEEPGELGRVFSEVEGEFHRLERQRPGEYVKTNTKGRKNYYTFDKEHMKEARVDSGFYRFEMKRRG